MRSHFDPHLHFPADVGMPTGPALIREEITGKTFRRLLVQTSFPQKNRLPRSSCFTILTGAPTQAMDCRLSEPGTNPDADEQEREMEGGTRRKNVSSYNSENNGLLQTGNVAPGAAPRCKSGKILNGAALSRRPGSSPAADTRQFQRNLKRIFYCRYVPFLCCFRRNLILMSV